MSESHKPNEMPLADRLVNIVYSVVLIAIGSYFLATGRMLLPGKRTAVANGLDLQGLTGWLMFGAVACGCIVLLSQVVDHYDRRDNESKYKQLGVALKYTGWSLFALALTLHLFGVGT